MRQAGPPGASPLRLTWYRLCYQLYSSGMAQNYSGCHLLVKLQSIEYRSPHPTAPHAVYFSVSAGDRMHFSSCVRVTLPLSVLCDDLILPVQGQELPECLYLQRWENHMLMFDHEIAISELRSRQATKKCHQTKAGEMLSFTVMLLRPGELRFGDKYVQSITQHYLILESLLLEGIRSQQRGDPGPSYYSVVTSGGEYVMPVLDGQLCIKLPETLVFRHYRNGRLEAQSRVYNSNEITSKNEQIELRNEGGSFGVLQLSLQWAMNASEAGPHNSLLLDAHELLVYDVEAKFDNYVEYTGARLKFVYGNKGYEVGTDFNVPKPPKINKIVYFIIKSEDEEVSIIVEKNLKIVAQSRFYTEEVTPFTVHHQKRKLLDNSGKAVGFVRFKCEKAKTLSTPHNNKFWKESGKKKTTGSITLSLQQVSVDYEGNDPLALVVKTENEEKTTSALMNIRQFDLSSEISYTPLTITAKSEENIYLMLKQSEPMQNKKDFVGIAVLNFSELRLGANTTEVKFFKNHDEVAMANCIINKVVPYPFVKSVFQPEVLPLGPSKVVALSFLLRNAELTPYFYTYSYDNKNEVYCIVEVNRLKKVLIMESSIHNDLAIAPTHTSDSLNFYIEETEHIKVKITMLVSDIGYEEEIYGSAQVKCRLDDLASRETIGLTFSNIEIKNDYGTIVGKVGLEVHLKQGDKQRIGLKKIQTEKTNSNGPFRSQIKRVKNDLDKVNQNVESIELSLRKKQAKLSKQMLKNQKLLPQAVKKPSRYDNSVSYGRRQRNMSMAVPSGRAQKLPDIRKSKQENLNLLINLMQIRKRGSKGYYMEGPGMEPYQPKYPVSQRAATKQFEGLALEAPSYTQRGSRENPNLELVPLRRVANKDLRQQNIRRQIQEYEQKLKGLRTALMNSDNQEAEKQPEEEPVVKIDHQQLEQQMLQQQQQPLKGSESKLELDGNEFARLSD